MAQPQQIASQESPVAGYATPVGAPPAQLDPFSTGLRFQYRRAVIQAAPARAPTQRRRLTGTSWKLVRLANHGRVAVVGESFYQPALIAITGRHEWKEVQKQCTAILLLEPRNPHDPNAVRVEIKRQLVGYLSRADAVSYGPYLRRLARFRRLPCCEALISGRGPGSETQHMGVFLYISAPGPELLVHA
jgi:hypothetical protein